MEKNAKIYVSGHCGMVGSAIVRELKRQGYTNILTRTHKELDLCRQDDVENFFAAEKPDSYGALTSAKGDELAIWAYLPNRQKIFWTTLTIHFSIPYCLYNF